MLTPVFGPFLPAVATLPAATIELTSASDGYLAWVPAGIWTSGTGVDLTPWMASKLVVDGCPDRDVTYLGGLLSTTPNICLTLHVTDASGESRRVLVGSACGSVQIYLHSSPGTRRAVAWATLPGPHGRRRRYAAGMVTYTDPGPIEYDGVLERSDVSNASAYVPFPFDVKELFGVKGRVPVIVHFDDIEYRGSLVSYGGPHKMLMLREIREKLGKLPR